MSPLSRQGDAPRVAVGRRVFVGVRRAPAAKPFAPSLPVSPHRPLITNEVVQRDVTLICCPQASELPRN